MACLPMMLLVEEPLAFCFAVTVTSLRLSDVSIICNVRLRSFDTLSLRFIGSYPTYVTFSV